MTTAKMNANRTRRTISRRTTRKTDDKDNDDENEDDDDKEDHHQHDDNDGADDKDKQKNEEDDAQDDENKKRMKFREERNLLLHDCYYENSIFAQNLAENRPRYLRCNLNRSQPSPRVSRPLEADTQNFSAWRRIHRKNSPT